MSVYVPDAGDIVWLSLDPQRGREQAGRRPFLVLTPRAYNEKTSLVVGCPITAQIKGYPFEVSLPSENRITGAVLADQIKSVDWRRRDADFAERANTTSMRATRTLIAALLKI